MFVQLGNEPQAWIPWRNAVHDAFSVICWTNACRCSPGRNLKNRETECKSTSGFPLSKFAPARKSAQDRKSTRLNSSHLVISYAVFCLKKKKGEGAGGRGVAARESSGADRRADRGKARGD